MSKKGLLLVLLVGVGVALWMYRDQLSPKPKFSDFPQRYEKALQELKTEDLKVGSGARAAARGDRLKIHYESFLADGRKVDSSRERKQPLEFVLGSAQVLLGWDAGLVGIKAGGVRKLTVPPYLAYGEKAVGDLIPANSTVTFEIEAIEVTGPASR